MNQITLDYVYNEMELSRVLPKVSVVVVGLAKLHSFPILLVYSLHISISLIDIAIEVEKS